MTSFFERLGVPEDERTPDHLEWYYVDKVESHSCGLCGARIMYRFYLRHKPTHEREPARRDNLLMVGSDCIQTYLSAHPVLLRRFRSDKDRMIENFKRSKDQEDLGVAISMIEALPQSEVTEKVLTMLRECKQNRWPFTEKRREWARNVIRKARTAA